MLVICYFSPRRRLYEPEAGLSGLGFRKVYSLRHYRFAENTNVFYYQKRGLVVPKQKK